MILAVVFAILLLVITIARGVSVIDASLSVVVLTLQVPTGVLIWLKAASGRRHDWPTLVGAGLAIGSLVTVAVDQLLISAIGVSGLGAVIPGVISIPLMVASLRRATVMSLRRIDMGIVLTSTAASAMLLAWGNSDPAMAYAAVLLTGCAILATRVDYENLPTRRLPVALVSGLLLVALFVLIRTQQLVPVDIPRELRDVILGADDQIKSEQLSYSLATRGLFSNSAAVDLPIRFHWMSLAWVGAMTTASGSAPFALTLHLAPFAAVVACGLLVSSLVRNVTNHRWLLLLSPAVIIASNADGSLRSAFALTSSNVIPSMWLLLMLLVLVCIEGTQSRSSNRWALGLFAILPVVVMLGKGPYGVTVAAGLGLAAILILSSARYRGRRLVLLGAIGCAVVLQVLAYLAFLRSELTDGFEIGVFWARFPYPLPFRFISSPTLFDLVLGAAILTSFLAIRYLPLVLSGFRETVELPRVFALGCALGGLLSFAVFQTDGTVRGSETYFVNAAVIVVAAFSLASSATHGAPSRSIVGGLLSAALVAAINQLQSAPATSRFLLGSVTTIVIALVGTIRLPSSQRFATLCQTLIVAALMFGIVTTSWTNPNLDSEVSGSLARELETFEWIRRETPGDSVFVTNRELCAERVTCGYSGMPTATAFSQRAFVLEGLRTLTPAAVWDLPPPEPLRPLVIESRSYVDWALGRSERPKLPTTAQWVLAYHDAPIPETAPVGLLLRHRSLDGRIGIFEIVNRSSD